MGRPWLSEGPGRKRADSAHTGAPSCRCGSCHTRHRSHHLWLQTERCQSGRTLSGRCSYILTDRKSDQTSVCSVRSSFPRLPSKPALYFCRQQLHFALQASRGSRGGSLHTSRSSLQLCCADTHIGRGPETQTSFSCF